MSVDPSRATGTCIVLVDVLFGGARDAAGVIAAFAADPAVEPALELEYAHALAATACVITGARPAR